MKVSKETKILAILLALFLLIGIGCGAAVATNDYPSWEVQFDTSALTAGDYAPSEYSALMESVLVAHVEGVQAHVEKAAE